MRKDNNTIEWNRENEDNEMNQSLIYRFPNSNQTLANTKNYTVKEHERAILLRNGEFISEMESGTYELDKISRRPGTEIVWIDITMHTIPWGIPQITGIRTKDGFLIGLFGDLKLHVLKPTSFYRYVIGGNIQWKKNNLKKWIKSLITTSLRDILRNYNLNAILSDKREALFNKVSSKIFEEFYLYGLSLDSFNILGFKAPESAAEILESNTFTSILQNQIHKQKKIKEVEEHTVILNRISSLKDRKRNLQDQLIENQITKEEFKEKNQMLTLFLEQAEVELQQFHQTKSIKDLK